MLACRQLAGGILAPATQQRRVPGMCVCAMAASLSSGTFGGCMRHQDACSRQLQQSALRTCSWCSGYEHALVCCLDVHLLHDIVVTATAFCAFRCVPQCFSHTPQPYGCVVQSTSCMQGAVDSTLWLCRGGLCALFCLRFTQHSLLDAYFDV
eukprot:GHRQ01001129.1.p2 GENE.GHRQ01001129.1~~GHRQ01001129.1.p2  ORF type:complete len:152 (+),score=10.91 GHRQ01001129.1:421-876(+)